MKRYFEFPIQRTSESSIFVELDEDDHRFAGALQRLDAAEEDLKAGPLSELKHCLTEKIGRNRGVFINKAGDALDEDDWLPSDYAVYSPREVSAEQASNLISVLP